MQRNSSLNKRNLASVCSTYGNFVAGGLFCSIPSNLFSSHKFVDLPVTFVYVFILYNFCVIFF